jgi:hypothetical protein
MTSSVEGTNVRTWKRKAQNSYWEGSGLGPEVDGIRERTKKGRTDEGVSSQKNKELVAAVEQPRQSP